MADFREHVLSYRARRRWEMPWFLLVLSFVALAIGWYFVQLPEQASSPVAGERSAEAHSLQF